MNQIGSHIEVTYRVDFNCTVCKCQVCLKFWTYKGEPDNMTVGEMSFLLAHDQDHDMYSQEELNNIFKI